jgi:hypothetical protein
MLTNFTSGGYYVYAGGCFVARNVTRRVTNNYYVENAGTLLDINGTTFGEKALAIVDDLLRVKTRNGGYIYLGPNSITCLGQGAELLAGSGGVVEHGGGEIAFLGEGSCIGLQQGTLRLQDNAELRVKSQGILASFDPSAIELGNNAKIIIEADGFLKWFATSNWVFGSNARVEVYGTIEVADGATLSLPHNSQFYIYPGAEVKMGSGASIYTEGKFHAVGNASNKIQFTSTAGWNGISAQNGNLTTSADLRLEHVEISGANRGVHLKTPLYATITNTTISGVTDMGIEIVPNLSNGGGPNQDVLLDHVAISTNDAYGIVMANTSTARILTGLYLGETVQQIDV